MKPLHATTACAAFAIALTLAGAPAAAADDLGEILRQTGWDRVLGTWVDAETQGATLKLTYAWKFKDKVVAITARAGERESVALVGVNAKTGDVYSMAADNQGGASFGKWRLEGGDAILELAYIRGDGREGRLKVRYHFEDDDTIVMTIERPDPIAIKLIRVQP